MQPIQMNCVSGSRVKVSFYKEGLPGFERNSFARHFGEHFGLAIIAYNSLFFLFFFEGGGGGGV